jgi:hypothetical protein
MQRWLRLLGEWRKGVAHAGRSSRAHSRRSAWAMPAVRELPELTGRLLMGIAGSADS